MKLKRSLKNKLKKFLFVLPIIIVVFSLVCLPVSAVYPSEYYVPISQPTTIDNNGYIEVLAQDGSGNRFVEVILFNVIATSSSGSNSQVLDSYGVVNFTEHRVTISGYVDNESSNPNISVAAFIVSNSGSLFTYTSSGRSLNIDYGSTILSARVYGDAVIGSIPSSFSNYSFIVGYGTDYVSVRSLYSISDFLNNDLLDYLDILEQNTEQISISIDSLSQQISISIGSLSQDIYNFTRDIISSIEQANDDSTNRIIANEKSNAQAIQDNADENTDKILNGWENDVEVESGDTGSLENSEKDFIANNQQAADDEVSAATDNIFSSVRRLSSSFGAVGTMFRQLTVRVPDFNVFIYFSLVIGIVPLIVGMTMNGLRASDRASARQRQEAAYKRGYNSGYTRGKGG